MVLFELAKSLHAAVAKVDLSKYTPAEQGRLPTAKRNTVKFLNILFNVLFLFLF